MKQLTLLIVLLLLLATACSSSGGEPTTEDMTDRATPTETALEPVEPTATTASVGEMTETAAASTPTEESAIVPESVATMTDPAIIFKRSGGIAGLEDEWIIYADGTVEGGLAAEGSLSTEQITQILADAEANGFFDLKDEYIDKNHCCDFFNYEVTLNLPDGRSHTDITAEQTPGMPPFLAQLIQELNDLVVSGGVEQ
jgi:hypothetical protein